MSVNFANIKIGSIYLVHLTDSTGNETDGDRPAVVLSKHDTKLIGIAPITKNQDATKFSYTLKAKRSKTNGLDLDSVVMIFQLRSISLSRFIRELGIMEDNHMQNIKQMIIQFFNL